MTTITATDRCHILQDARRFWVTTVAGMTLDRLLAATFIASLAGCAAPTGPTAEIRRPAAAASLSAFQTSESITVGDKQLRAPRVVLLDAGTGKRSPLTWTFRAPTRLAVTIDQELIGVGDDAHEGRAQLELTLDVTAAPAGAEAHTVHARLEAARVVSGTPIGDAADYPRLVNHGVTWVVTPQGHVVGGATVTPDDSDYTGEALVTLHHSVAAALFVPLPREPLGEKAAWRVRRPVMMEGTAFAEEAEYRLVVRLPAGNGVAGNIVVVTAKATRVPLSDERGLISRYDLDRAWAAVEATTASSFEQLARHSSPVPRGKSIATFADIDALVGALECSLHTNFDGSLDIGGNSQPFYGEVRERIEVRRLDAGQPAPAAPAK